MIKIFPTILRALPALIFLLLLAGCQEEDNSDELREQEQRFFDLYMGANFGDTLPPPTESGLYFIEVTEGEGPSPAGDDWVLVNYVGTLIPEEEVVDSYIQNVVLDNNLADPENILFGPVKLLNGTHTPGVTEGLTRMKEGGKAVMCFTSDLGFGSEGGNLMKKVGGFQSLQYEMELLRVIPDMDAYEQEKIRSYIDTVQGVANIWDDETDVNMYFVVDEETEGSQVEIDSVVEIHYKGYLTDGRVFDESTGREPYEFKVGDYDAASSPIRGWHLGVAKFKEGEKGRLIIPYQMAYGPSGRIDNSIVVIPPYETLIFDIEVVEVKESIDPDEPV
jgi:FKBP-type peptidyl-prolyl cis-trans isomerase